MQLVVGRITRPHGVRGEVSVEVRTDEPDRRFAVGRVLATDPVAAGPLTVESARWHSGRLLIQFAGVADRNQAEDLRGIWLTLDSAEAGPTGDPDEFHDHELIGLAVVTTSGEPVGRVTDVRHFGQDLLVIEPQPTDAVKPQPAGPVGSGPAGGRASPDWAGRPWPRPGARRPGPGHAGQRAAGPVRGRDRARGGPGHGPARHRSPARAARAGGRGIRSGPCGRNQCARHPRGRNRRARHPHARHPHARHPSGTNRPGSNRSGSSRPGANPSSRKLR